MSVLDSLPDRPLTDAELASLNRADAVTLAVDVTEADETTTDDVEGLLLGTENWLKGLVYGDEGLLYGDENEGEEDDGDGWRVVATEELGENERFDAMQTCEDAVRAALDGA